VARVLWSWRNTQGVTTSCCFTIMSSL